MNYVRLQAREDHDPLMEVSREVLLQRYEFFKHLLHDFQEGRQNHIKFEDVSASALHIVTDYIRSSYLPRSYLVANMDLLFEIWQFASVRLMHDLQNECADIVQHNISAESMLPSFRYAYFLDDTCTMKAVANTMRKCELSPMLTKQFLELSYEELVALLRNTTFNSGFHEVIAVWLKLDDDEEHCAAVLGAIEVNSMSEHDLIAHGKFERFRDLGKTQEFYARVNNNILKQISVVKASIVASNTALTQIRQNAANFKMQCGQITAIDWSDLVLTAKIMAACVLFWRFCPAFLTRNLAILAALVFGICNVFVLIVVAFSGLCLHILIENFMLVTQSLLQVAAQHAREHNQSYS